MKALLWTAYGAPRQVLQCGEAPRPKIKESEILVEVVAAAVHAGDWRVTRADPRVIRLMFGCCRPAEQFRVPGMEMAGRVVEVGAQCGGSFTVGDEVYADLSECGLGAFGEFVAVPEKWVARKPRSLSFEEAAACPVSGVTALQALRDKGEVTAGQSVLVVGAAGGVGHFAVQIAKSFGARVTGVCSTEKKDMVRALGADRVVDYKVEDVTKSKESNMSEVDLYDCIIDAGAHRPFFDYAPILAPQGRYVLVGGNTRNLAKLACRGCCWSKKNGKQFLTYLVRPNVADLQRFADMVEAGEVKPVIAARFPLEEAAEAVAFLEEGKAQGKVVINVRPS